MKANELRIGNIIRYKGQPKIVRWVKDDSIGIRKKNLQPITISINEIENITLTEGLLLKCGFTREKHGFTIQIVNNLDFVIDLENELTGYGLNWKDSACYRFKYINQVHQLQNLYFSLTGEELTVKL